MILTRYRMRVVFPLLMLWVVTAACLGVQPGPGPESPTPATATAGPAPSAIPSPTEATPESGGSLIIAIPEEPETLNVTLTEQLAARWVISTLDARLIRVREDGTLEPQLLAEVPTVENGGISADGRVYTLKFRPELQWSDEEPLDAWDFRFTWQTITNPAYPAVDRRGWDEIESVEISDDDLTATVRLREPSLTFVEEVLAGTSDNGRGFLLPMHLLADLSPQEIPEADYGGEKHIGSGPFKVARWVEGEQLIVERNGAFAGDTPRLDRIIFRFAEDARQAIAYLTTGEVDVAVDLPETALPDLVQVPNTTYLLTPRAGSVEAFGFNFNDPTDLTQPHPLFADPAVRHAIVLGFDRQAVVDDLLLGQTRVAGSLLDNTPWRASDLTPLPFDPERARQTLDAAGWTVQPDGVRARDGVRLSFTHSTLRGDDPIAVLHQEIQELFIADMQAIGIEVQPRNYTASGFEGPNGVLATRAFDLIDLPTGQRGGVEQLIWRYSSAAIPTPQQPNGGNVMGYSNPTVDRLLAAQAQEFDPARRQELLDEVQHMIQDDMPIIPIYDHLEIDVARRYVQGLEPGSLSGLWWNPEAWWVNRKELDD